MAKNNSDNLEMFIFCTVIVVIILIIIAVVVAFNRRTPVEHDENFSLENYINVETENIVKAKEEEDLSKLKQMTERNRIEHYSSKFFGYIEKEEYDEAYSLLNNDFKQNYFPTLAKFSEYCKSKFTKMMDMRYTNFERNGEIYVIWLTVTDAINGGKNSGEEINVVVKEHDYNDFELSFSVI